VTVAARINERGREVRVVDEGIGIPEEEQRRIFTKFYRGESMTRDPSTTGTGRALHRPRDSSRNGRTDVGRLARGAGSSFAFELPLAPHAALSGRETG